MIWPTKWQWQWQRQRHWQRQWQRRDMWGLAAVAEALALGRRLWIRHCHFWKELNYKHKDDEKDKMRKHPLWLPWYYHLKWVSHSFELGHLPEQTTKTTWIGSATSTSTNSQHHPPTKYKPLLNAHHSGMVATVKPVNKLKPWQTNKAVSRKLSKLLVIFATCSKSSHDQIWR